MKGRKRALQPRHPPEPRAHGAFLERHVARRVERVLGRLGLCANGAQPRLTLDEIGVELAKLPPDRAPNRRDWSRLSSGWTSRIDDRIAELERLKLGLTGCIGCGCLSLERCKLANPDDRAARLGPGPRYWVGDRPEG